MDMVIGVWWANARERLKFVIDSIVELRKSQAQATAEPVTPHLTCSLSCSPATSKAEFNRRFLHLSTKEKLRDYYSMSCPGWEEACCPECAVQLFEAEQW